MTKPSELLTKLLESLADIGDMSPKLTDKQLESLLRKVQMHWKLERPFKLHTLN